MPLHMRMPKHGFKSRKKVNKIILKTDLINNLLEKKIIKENSKLSINDLTMYSKSKKNVFIKILLGQKLNKAVNLESHSASDTAKKEFERTGGSINIVEFKKLKKINENNLDTNSKKANKQKTVTKPNKKETKADQEKSKSVSKNLKKEVKKQDSTRKKTIKTTNKNK